MTKEIVQINPIEVTDTFIQNIIIKLPNRPPAILDKDMAILYETTTSAINRAVKRNPERFPSDFMFQSTDAEKTILTCQFGMSQKTQTANPYLFTRAGANMLSAVLHTDIAIDRSIQIHRFFSKIEEEFWKLCEQPPEFFLNNLDMDLATEREMLAMRYQYKQYSLKMLEFTDISGRKRLFENQPFEQTKNYEKGYSRIEDQDWLVRYFDLTKKGLYQEIEKQMLKWGQKVQYAPRYFDKNNPSVNFFHSYNWGKFNYELDINLGYMKRWRTNLYQPIVR